MLVKLSFENFPPSERVIHSNSSNAPNTYQSHPSMKLSQRQISFVLSLPFLSFSSVFLLRIKFCFLIQFGRAVLLRQHTESLEKLFVLATDGIQTGLPEEVGRYYDSSLSNSTIFILVNLTFFVNLPPNMVILCIPIFILMIVIFILVVNIFNLLSPLEIGLVSAFENPFP